jgi:lipase (class 3)
MVSMIPTREFNLTLACDCVAACAAAYAGPPTMQTSLCHCIVTQGSEFDTLAFRGSHSLSDWRTDFSIRRRAAGGGEEIHEGFDCAISSIAPQLLDLWHSASRAQQTDPAAPCRPLVVTGHSLGGAMAQLAAEVLFKAGAPIAAVYTFGGPRVGNEAWAAGYELILGSRTWRVVDELDLVPRVPFIGYCHAGHRVQVGLPLLGGLPTLQVDPPIWRLLLSDAWETWRAYKARTIGELSDHPVSKYAERLAEIAGPAASPAPGTFWNRKDL